MAPRDSFTSRMTFEGRVWSTTKAMESGLGSTLKSRNCCADIVLIDRKIPPGEAGHEVSLGVLDRDGNLDEVDLHDEPRRRGVALFGRGGLFLLLDHGWLAGRDGGRLSRLRLRLAGGRGRIGTGWLCSSAAAGRDGALNARQRGRGLRRGRIGHSGVAAGPEPPKPKAAPHTEALPARWPSIRLSQRFHPPSSPSAHAFERIESRKTDRTRQSIRRGGGAQVACQSAISRGML